MCVYIVVVVTNTIYINDKKFTNYENKINPNELMENKYLLIRKGKRIIFCLR